MNIMKKSGLSNIKLTRKVFLLVIASILVLTSGCSIKLTPDFNQKITDNISDVSRDIFKLMAESKEGTQKINFSTREPKYNEIIAKLKVLKLEIISRPVPSNSKLEKIYKKINEGLKKNGIGETTIDLTKSPSEAIINNIIKNIEQMKKADSNINLQAGDITGFNNNIEIYLDQIATYENALKN